MLFSTVTIIADAPASTPARRIARGAGALPLISAGLAALWGTGAAAFYFSQGLALSHYDARAHLVVARRILDSLTPGWEQVGAVWLPLPHVLDMLPVQIDVLYRTGASGIALSIAGFALGVYALTRLVLDATGSRVAAAVGALLLASNPNLLYLQSTPMTEPLLLGLLLFATWTLFRWSTDPAGWTRLAGWSLVGGVLTRYEAWPFTGAALAVAALARSTSGTPPRQVLAESARLALYPLLAIGWFMIHSRITIGRWFVTGGFYVPDPALQGQIVEVTRLVLWGTGRLGSWALLLTTAGALILLARAAVHRRRAAVLIAAALLAVAALPWYAFYQGHPFRIRYMVPLVAGAIACTSVAIGLVVPRARGYVASAVLLATLATTRPFDPAAAMVQEAQWDVWPTRARGIITRCLTERAPDDVVLMSMGSLAHYMQNLSSDGFDIRDFVHEGNFRLWDEAFRSPGAHVNWIVVEERSEGGDVIARRIASDPRYLREFSRVCEAAGVALYRRHPRR